MPRLRLSGITRFAFPIILISLSSFAWGAEERSPIVYTVRIPEPAKQIAEVEMIVPTDKQATIDLKMAQWSPGFYRIEDYANRVLDIVARMPDGKKLEIERSQKNRWRIQTEGSTTIVVSYRLKCEERSVTRNWVGDDYALLNGPATFIMLAEKGPRPHEVRIELPAQWKQSITALDAAPDKVAHHYRADTFDVLADSPIVAGNPTLAEFEVDGSKHILAGIGEVERWDARQASIDLAKVVREHQRMWGFLPFKKYVYFCAFRPGGGGLEHANSTVVTTNPAGMQTPRGYVGWLGLVSHEYFHAYNVKRLRPVELGPFDYETEVHTSGLWVAEGLTTYYGDLVIHRAGLAKPLDYLGVLSSQIMQLQNSAGRLVQSLDQSSLDVWTSSFSGIGGGPKTISYYVKGPIVGFLLDAHIRRATGGTKSLDDLMKLAYRRYSGERGFTADEFRATAEEVAGIDLKEWFRKTLSSTEELEYDEALDWFGLQFASPDQKTAEPAWRLEERLDATNAQKARLTAWLDPASAPRSSWAKAERGSEQELPTVVSPPEVFFAGIRDRDRDAARKFYKKYIDVKGMPVVASAEVADEALQRTYYLVTHLLAGRPDILNAMVKNHTRLIIIGKNQVYTDMPEYRNHPNPAYQNERVRGTGGLDVTSFGEENLLNLPLDRYDDESIAVHEFCHTIDAALSRIDPDWRKRLTGTYRATVDKGLWKHAYTRSNPAEYWAEICQSYFDCNRVNNWNHASVATREQLKQYDPDGYELVKSTFKLSPENDWRYRPLRAEPSVTPPPDKFKINPYYLKFTFAREFLVLGSKHVSDEAMLAANDVIRKMFAYRHDILKALIADGARLVVLGRKEKLSDLPEFKDAKNKDDFEELRYLDYTPALKLMVVPEENVLGLSQEPFAGQCVVISVFAKALYVVTGSRPVIADFDKPRYDRQQYELRVKRLDVEFDRRLRKIYDEAMEKRLWKGTPAAHNPVQYWVAGVEAYFDATGAGYPPNLTDRPITTRESLKAYDADLFALVDETMAYKEHVDWRFKPRGLAKVGKPE